MSLKPIEPGCLALHVSKYPENNKVVRVIRRLGRLKDERNGIYWRGIQWEIAQPLRTYDVYGVFGVRTVEPTDIFEYHASEDQLIRIDGDTFEEDTMESYNELERMK